ncbi:hypothetical protein Salat_1622600 [Sesamum alatum]|uniref:Uncharacterized protein n=1 Tax=Sesamum alatum TaxID=300844 RepID=A0AAE2CJB4_9LAMI|nr:hypothetical protein Salat_1622600 [Sesamum alatum]
MDLVRGAQWAGLTRVNRGSTRDWVDPNRVKTSPAHFRPISTRRATIGATTSIHRHRCLPSPPPPQALRARPSPHPQTHLTVVDTRRSIQEFDETIVVKTPPFKREQRSAREM